MQLYRRGSIVFRRLSCHRNQPKNFKFMFVEMQLKTDRQGFNRYIAKPDGATVLTNQLMDEFPKRGIASYERD